MLVVILCVLYKEVVTFATIERSMIFLVFRRERKAADSVSKSVRPSVHPFVSNLSFEPTEFKLEFVTVCIN